MRVAEGKGHVSERNEQVDKRMCCCHIMSPYNNQNTTTRRCMTLLVENIVFSLQ